MTDGSSLGPPAGGSGPLRDDEFQLLVEVYDELMALLPAERNCNEFIELGRARFAGPASTRAVLKRYGCGLISTKLLRSAGVLRSTGHFSVAARTEALSAIISAWERRAVRRNSRPGF